MIIHVVRLLDGQSIKKFKKLCELFWMGIGEIGEVEVRVDDDYVGKDMLKLLVFERDDSFSDDPNNFAE
jgi:hypothetical protein